MSLRTDTPFTTTSSKFKTYDKMTTKVSNKLKRGIKYDKLDAKLFKMISTKKKFKKTLSIYDIIVSSTLNPNPSCISQNNTKNV